MYHGPHASLVEMEEASRCVPSASSQSSTGRSSQRAQPQRRLASLRRAEART